jgi:hypothetical protein
MKTEVLPFMFGRMGGAPFDLLLPLEDIDLNNCLAELDVQLLRVTEVKAELNNTLYSEIRNASGSERRNILLALKRDIYNDRKVDFQYYDASIKNSEKLTTDLCLHFLIQQRTSRLRECIESRYNHVIHQSITYIKEISDSYFLKNGLLFSSRDMLDTLENLRNGNLPTIKKQLTGTLSLLKYMTRSAAKTSPFSSFNGVFLLQQDDKFYRAERVVNLGSHVSINNIIFELCKNMLLFDAPVRRHLQVLPNTTLNAQRDQLTFFRNDNNKEFFCNVNSVQLVDFIIEYLKLERLTTYADLCERIKDETGEASHRIADYVDQLIDAGIIKLHLPASIKDKNWAGKLVSFLDSLISKNYKSKVISCVSVALRTLLKSIDVLKNTSDVNVRKSTIDGAFNVVKECMGWEQHRNAKNKTFLEKLSAENIFYEDLTTDNVQPVDVSNLGQALSSVSELLGHLQCATRKASLRKQIALKLERTYYGKAIPLLSYYREQVSAITSDDEAHDDHLHTLGVIWNPFFKELPKVVHNVEVDISAFVSKRLLHPEFNCDLFAQIANIDGQGTLIINNLLTGVATNISRFINLYPSDHIVNRIKQALNSTYKTSMLADLTDASLHNTNTFPAITDHIIDASGGVTKCKCNIPLTDLWITSDKDQHAILINAAGKRVVPIDFSMESIERKSGLMKFIDIFGPGNSESTFSFLDTYENLVLEHLNFESKQIAVVPRLKYTDNVIVSRRKWFIKADFLDRLLNQSALSSESFVGFHLWRKKNGVPVHIFVRTNVKTHKRSKPQYINLTAPLMFMLFRNMVAKCNAAAIIELSEMLPTPDQLTQDKNGKHHVMEYIIGMYNLN